MERLYVLLERALPAIGVIVYIALAVKISTSGTPQVELPDSVAIPFIAGFIVLLPIWFGSALLNLRKKIERNHEATTDRIAQLNGHVDALKPLFVQKFDTTKSYYNYLTDLAVSCRTSWLDMGGFDPRQADIDPRIRQEYYRRRAELAARIDNFAYLGYITRREHLDRVKAMITKSKTGSSKVKSYASDLADPSKVEVTIIDDEVLVMGYYQEAELQNYVSLRDPDVIALFRAYYMDIWKKPENVDLKVGARVFTDAIRDLERTIPA